MLPAEGRQVGQQVIGHVLGLAQGGNGTAKIPRVPKDYSGNNEVEARGAMLLVFIGPITDLAKPMNEHRSRKAVA